VLSGLFIFCGSTWLPTSLLLTQNASWDKVAKISHAQLSFTFVPKMNEAGFTSTLSLRKESLQRFFELTQHIPQIIKIPAKE
jgi:hypothetical protein